MSTNTSGGGVRGRRPSFNKRLYSRISRGVEITQSSPGPRGKNLHPKTKEQMEFFRQTQWAYKFTDPAIQVLFREVVAGTALLPRDLFLMAMAGRMTDFVMPDGTQVFSMAEIGDVSSSLDRLGQFDGMILTRSDGMWAGLDAGPDTFVLTAQGEGIPPAWAPPSAGAGAAWSALPPLVIAAPTPFIDIDVSAFNDIMIYGKAVTAAAATFRGVYVSTDGGLTYFNTNGNYQSTPATGVPTATFLALNHGTASNLARDFGGTVHGLRLNGVPKFMQNAFEVNRYFVANLLPITHLRIACQNVSAGAKTNMTGGTIYLSVR